VKHMSPVKNLFFAVKKLSKEKTIFSRNWQKQLFHVKEVSKEKTIFSRNCQKQLFHVKEVSKKNIFSCNCRKQLFHLKNMSKQNDNLFRMLRKICQSDIDHFFSKIVSRGSGPNIVRLLNM